MSRPSVLIKILKLWKRDTKVDWIPTSWQTIAGVFNENILEKLIPEDRSHEILFQSKVTQNLTFSPKFFKGNNNVIQIMTLKYKYLSFRLF